MDTCDSPERSKPVELQLEEQWDSDLDYCPRCGEGIDQVIWGQTNCLNCGLHFECC